MNPIFYDDEDDFTLDQAKAAFDRYQGAGAERERELANTIPKARDGDYRVPHCSADHYADFYARANYEHFQKNYPWLDTGCVLDPDKVDRDWFEFLMSIPQESWEAFLEDVTNLKQVPYEFASDRAFELEQEEVTRYWKEDAHWDLLGGICDKLDDAFQHFCVRSLTPDQTWDFVTDNDAYPESQGDGSVYIDTDALAEKFDWDAYFSDTDLTQLRQDWQNVKRQAWRQEHGDIFEKALAWAVQNDTDKVRKLSGMEDRELFHLFDKVVGNKVAEEEPSWRWHGWNDKPENRWIVALTRPKSTESAAGYIERGVAKAAMVAAAYLMDFKMPAPIDHPELPLQFESQAEGDSYDPDEDWDLARAEQWIKQGGYDSATEIYKDERVRVIIPRTIHTLHKYIPNDRSQTLDGARYKGEIFIVIPDKTMPPDPSWGTLVKDPFVVYEDERELKAGAGGQAHKSVFDDALTDKFFGPSLRKAFVGYYRRVLRGSDEKYKAEAKYYLLQTGGFKAIQRQLHRYPPGEDDAMDFHIGIEAAKVGNLPVASRYLGIAPELMNKDGFFLVYADWGDTTALFHENSRDTASKIFGYDFDWVDAWQMEADIDDVFKCFTPEQWQELRTVLINRHYTDQDTDESVLLTRESMAEIDDGALADMIKDEEFDRNDRELEEVREQLERAWHYAVESAIHDGWYKAATDAVEDILGPGKFADFRGSEKLHFFIQWKQAYGALDKYKEDSDGAYDGSLGDLVLNYAEQATLPEDVSWRIDSGVMQEAISAQLGELDMLEQAAPEGQLEFGLEIPSRRKWVHVQAFSEHYPDGATVQMREADYVLARQREPWKYNKQLFDQWMTHRQQTPGNPPAPGLGESLLEGAAYTYGCAMIDAPQEVSDFVIEWGKLNIPDEWLYVPDETYGREREVHTTVKYGFTQDVAEELRQIAESTEPFRIVLGSVSLFENPEFDVVKLSVESDGLRALNAKCSQLPNADRFPTYNPHVTIAYVQKGVAKHLVGQSLWDGEGSPGGEWVANGMTYKGATPDRDDPNRVNELLPFNRTKRPAAVGESADPDAMDVKSVIKRLAPVACWAIAKDTEDLGRFYWAGRPNGRKGSWTQVAGNATRFTHASGQRLIQRSLQAGFPYALSLEQVPEAPVQESTDPDDIDIQAYVNTTYEERRLEDRGYMRFAAAQIVSYVKPITYQKYVGVDINRNSEDRWECRVYVGWKGADGGKHVLQPIIYVSRHKLFDAAMQVASISVQGTTVSELQALLAGLKLKLTSEVTESVDPDDVDPQDYLKRKATRTFRFTFDFGADEEGYSADIEVPIYAFGPEIDDGDMDAVTAYTQANAAQIPKDDWLWLVDVQLVDITESVDPDDVDPQGYINQMPIYYELICEYPAPLNIGPRWINSAGGYENTRTRLSYKQAKRLKAYLEKHYGNAVRLTMRPSEDQSQMYTSGMLWPQDFTESLDPDDPGQYIDDLKGRDQKQWAVYIDRAPAKIYANPDGTLADRPVPLTLQNAVKLMRMATKAGNTPCRMERVQEQHQPFDGLPFPAQPSELRRFLRGSKRPAPVIL